MRFACAVLCAVCVAATGCTLNRAIPGHGSDAGLTFDARTEDTSVPRVDAWVDPAIDGGACVPSSCTDGRECIDGACMCPTGLCCPVCPGGQVCNAGHCDPVVVACGAA